MEILDTLVEAGRITGWHVARDRAGYLVTLDYVYHYPIPGIEPDDSRIVVSEETLSEAIRRALVELLEVTA